MHISARDASPSMVYNLLASTIVPRPIAFVTTLSKSGVSNAAPYSFFNAMGSAPPVLALGCAAQSDGSLKDTTENILETGEFVVNMVSQALAEHMNACSAPHPKGVSELETYKIDTTPSISVQPPRISASPVSFECRLMEHLKIKAGGCIILGEVTEFHLDDAILTSSEPLRVDPKALDPVARLGGPFYAGLGDLFELKRPKF